MAEPVPIYLVGPSGPLRDRIVAELELPGDALLEDGAPLLGDDRPSPGVVLVLDHRSPPDATLRILRELTPADSGWTVCLAREEGADVGVRTLSLGWRRSLEDVDAFRGGEQGSLLELRRVVERFSRARHDINNPLTSGMAETQLLLMDVEDPELRSALETVQAQLRRIRDLVAATRDVRPGSDGPGGPDGGGG